jgi:peroxiredoxin
MIDKIPLPTRKYMTTNTTRSALAAAAAALFIILAGSGAALAALRIGDPAPRIELADLAGTTVSLPDSSRSQVTVIHFWTTGCGSCREEMQTLDGLYRTYRRKGMAIFAVNIGDPRERIRDTLAGITVSFPIVADPTRKSVRPYSVTGVPRTFILDRNGTIRYKIIGSTTKETLARYLQSLL